MTNIKFTNRIKNSKKLLMILAGYKRDLWSKVFERVKKFVSDDIDICIVSSGVYDVSLEEIAKDLDCSYLSTSINNLCLAQNECIKLHSNAEIIFKMDEDIFLTENCLKNLEQTFIDVITASPYTPGCVVPLINVNCVTYRRLLEDCCLLGDFISKFGSAPITNGLHHHEWVLENPDVAKYMWEHINIDGVLEDDSWEVCPVRFSIGLVLFLRDAWTKWNEFPVELDAEKEYQRIGLGTDEKHICQWCMMKSFPIIISHRSIVGHLAYGPQTKEMLKFFKENEKLF